MNTLLVLLHLAVGEPAAVPVPAYVPAVVERWKGMIDVKVVAMECGYRNAWYTVADHTVTLCSELFVDPLATMFILNHELGHAFCHQNGIPDIDGEVAADELGFLMSTNDEVTGGIRFLLGITKKSVTDPHPPALDRAAALLCLQDAREGEGNAQCRMYYRSIQASWTRWAVLVAEARRG